MGRGTRPAAPFAGAEAAFGLVLSVRSEVFPPKPIIDLERQAAVVLVGDWVGKVEAAAAAAGALLADRAGRSVEPLFTDCGAAVAWFSQNRASLALIMEIAEAVGLDEQLWRIAVAAETMLGFGGDAALSGTIAGAGLRAAVRLKDPRAVACGLMVRGSWAAMNGRPAAVADYQMSASMFRQLGNRRTELVVLIRLAGAYLELGDLDQAAECVEQVLKQTEDEVVLGLATLVNARIAADLNDHARAVELAAWALKLLGGGGAAGHLQVLPHLVQARSHARSGDVNAAGTALAAAIVQTGPGPDHQGTTDDLRVTTAEVRLVQGRLFEASAALDLWQSDDRVGRTPTARGDVLDLRARIVRAGRGPKRALELHRAALDERLKAQVPVRTARTLACLAELDAEVGEHDAARRSRDLAMVLLAGCTDTAAAALCAQLSAVT